MQKALEDQRLTVESADTARVPKTTVQLDEKSAIQILRLVEKLESLEDVQKVYFNAEFSDDVFASYAVRWRTWSLPTVILGIDPGTRTPAGA